MDLIDNLRTLATKIPKLKQEGLIKTEEGTKNALVMPFINALGYNVFDPTEVTPELIADMGTKKGEKVDYAILKDNKPIILVECKTFGTNLKEIHASQLYRYFTVTSARFGVLTDGVIYRFYTDLVTPNIMDADPFFIFDMLDIKEPAIEELKKFSKSMFDEAGIVSNASALKYKSLIKGYFSSQLTQPTEGFIRLCIQESKAYTGRLTQGVIDDFAPIIRESLRMFITDQVEARLKSALARDTSEEEPKNEPQAELSTAEQQQAIVTTQEEIEAYFIVKAILRETVDAKRIVMRDQQSYCGILLDDNNRRPICRLRFNGTQKHIGFINDQRAEEKITLTSLDDLYNYKDRLIAVVNFYDHK
ncbi:MAG: type I restriction enzyme HsdR N-terminal domain-containing protein [Anaerolineae bacterium]|nr:type I restriction enzyme HsdR N-terminal domain-containing protein [Anaerolineae bacterium]